MQKDDTAILVATSSGVQKALLRRALHAFSSRVYFVDNGAAALQTAKITELRLAILQASLPQVSGLEVCAQLTQLPESIRPAVLLFSSDVDVAQAAAAAGASAFLTTPFYDVELLARLRALLTQRWRVLYLDPDPDDRRHAQDVFTAAGYEPVICGSEAEMETAIGYCSPDLICLSTEQTHGTEWSPSYTICDLFKNAPELADIPVVLCSTAPSRASLKRGFAAGADDYLPKPFEQQEVTQRISRLRDKSSGEHRKPVMIVEDSDTERQAMNALLSARGYEVIAAGDGVEALKMLAQSTPALLITDENMPRMVGTELVRHVRKLESAKGMPIVIVSSQASREDRSIGIHSGADCYLSKPYDDDQLLIVIDRLLREASLQKEVDAMRVYVSEAAVSHARTADASQRQGSDMRAEERMMTVLFCDIVGFTPMCESLRPREVVAVLNEYFDLAVEVLKNNDAIIDKFIGDAVMAIFDKLESGAYRAVKSGMEIIDALRSHNSKSDYPLEVRIGINTGDVIMGDLGSRHHRRDFTCIGDAVNIAQRLESEAATNSVLISGSTHELVRQLVTCQDERKLQVKGRNEPVTCYSVESFLHLNL